MPQDDRSPRTPAGAEKGETDKQLLQRCDELRRGGRLAEVPALLAPALAGKPSFGLLFRMLTTLLQLGRVEEVAALRPGLMARISADQARRGVGELWQLSRSFATKGLSAPAQVAAEVAAEMLARHDVLAGIPQPRLLDGLLADSRDAEGAWTLPILARVLAEGDARHFAMKFLGGLGGDRPSLNRMRPLDRLAERARAVAARPDAAPGLREAAALVLFGAQDLGSALQAAEGAPEGGLGALVGEDVTRRITIAREIRDRALAAPAKVQGVLRDHPPFIVVHTGKQDYVALSAASLVLQNGAGNVVLLGNAETETIGVGRYAALTDYFEAAGRLAETFVHQSVMEPRYGLFSFQRWLVVEEYCRKNRIDQCVVIDSDALAFSSGSEIIGSMPEGYGMNDWTWTTTVRDTAALSALSDFTLGIYAGTPEAIAEVGRTRGKLIAGGTRRTFQDMHLFYYFRDTHPDVVVSQYLQPFHGGLDQAATLENGVELGVPGELALVVPGRPLKRPYFEGGRLHFRKQDGSLVRFHTVHCQGPAKAAMHHYAALLLPGRDRAVARWRDVEAGAPPAASQAAAAAAPEARPAGAVRPAPAPAPAPAPVRHGPMPNLKKPEHAVLAARVKESLGAAMPLRAQVSVSFPKGARVAAGSDIPVRVSVRNTGPNPLPVLVEGYEALQIGFVFTAESPGGPRKLREARVSLPEDSLAAQQQLEVNGTLPTSLLPPGHYTITADLVYDYVRWFDRDGSGLERLGLEIRG